jgi:hypothetical protein
MLRDEKNRTLTRKTEIRSKLAFSDERGNIERAQLLTVETILAPMTRPLATGNGVRYKKTRRMCAGIRLHDGAQEDESQKLGDLRIT